MSRVLRDDPGVLPETKARVFAACEELGYRVSIGGRLLAEGRKAVIGLSLSERVLPTDRYTSVIHQHLVRNLQASGWSAVLLPAEGFEASLSDIGAAILIGVETEDERLRAASAIGLPAVAIGHPEAEAFSVAPDDLLGGEMAARYLRSAGRRSLAIMSAARSTGDPGLERRRAGFLSVAAAAGVGVAELPIEHVPTASLAGYKATAALTAGVDGVFCDTDEAALGVLTALRDKGASLGADGNVSLIGFDDMPGIADAAGLTTIAQDFAQIARSALELRQDAERGLPKRSVLSKVELVERST